MKRWPTEPVHPRTPACRVVSPGSHGLDGCAVMASWMDGVAAIGGCAGSDGRRRTALLGGELRGHCVNGASPDRIQVLGEIKAPGYVVSEGTVYESRCKLRRNFPSW